MYLILNHLNRQTMKPQTIVIAILAVFILSAVSGCQYLKKRVVKKEKTEYKLNTAGKIRIEIDNSVGNVDVITADDTLNMIYLIAEKTDRVRVNDQDKPLDGIEIKIDSSGNVIKVDTEIKHFGTFLGDKSDAKVNYILKVPAKFQAFVNVTVGTINANNLQSDSKFETVNGSINLNNCSGILSIETVNGSIKANIDSTKGINAETTNGSITIGNMKNVNASVEANVTNGKVKFDNLVFTSVNNDKKSLSGKLGTGGNLIKLTTVNGSIKLDGNYLSINKKEHPDFNIKFDFDDDDEPVKIDFNDEDNKQVKTEKDKDSSTIKEAPKSK
jgi:hypothetical protein